MSKTATRTRLVKRQATGELVASVGQRYALIRTGMSRHTATPKSETADELLRRAGKALSKPGIARESVFGPSKSRVFAYSVYSKDPSKVVRRSADGSMKIGRVVGGKFKSR